MEKESAAMALGVAVGPTHDRRDRRPPKKGGPGGWNRMGLHTHVLYAAGCCRCALGPLSFFVPERCLVHCINLLVSCVVRQIFGTG